MKNLLILGLAICCSLFPTSSVFSQYELAQTLGAPYVQSIHPSQDKKSLAWVVNEAGARNIWYTEIDNVQPTQLTDYAEDDGQNISQVHIASGFLIFVRGNGNNRQGQPANPASLTITPQRQILRLNLTSKKEDVIAYAAGPVLRPDGKGLIYAKSRKVYMVEDLTEDQLSIRILFEARNGAGELSWSPDGNSVAFVSNRGNHSFVGVYSLGEDKITWMSPGFGFDADPAWSPDGKQVAFIRLPGQNKDQLFNIMGGREFEVMVADVESGTAKSIWKSPADDGGFSQYYPSHPLRWTKGNKILFYSEHEGWMHIYAMNPDGTEVTDLIEGECEVENYDLSTDERSILVTSNCEDINRRHIWKVNISSGTPEMLTDQAGIQTSPVALANGVMAYREGTTTVPTSAILHNGRRRVNLVELSNAFPEDQLIEPKAVEFVASDGMNIHGQLFLPKGNSEGNAPAVIFMHGGPIRQMLMGYHYRGYYANAYIFNQYLASKGYVVLSVNYRAGIGYGKDFRRAEKQGPRGASEYNDILAAGKYLQGLDEVDPAKIGLWGGSYGGYLTAMGLAKNSDLFKAGVDLHGVHDWAWRGRDFSPGGSWGITEELMDLAYHSSPISELQYWSSPVLLITGDDDRNVMFGQSIDLKNKLDKLGVHNETLVFPDEVHGFLRYESWLRTYTAAEDFFDRFLRGE
ncbi:MAG: prolyl oligopeptidase family serine peptidase [Bacteroidota bacterium]